jgi:hypothetical protein
MPRYDDDDDDTGYRRRNDEGKSDSGRDRVVSSDFKGAPNVEERANKEDESRRNLRWITFSKSRVVFGFDHLGPSDVPTMANQPRGLSLSFEKISGWQIPNLVAQDMNSGVYEFNVQLSLSMFHINSGSFFGSTWMGESVPLDAGVEHIDLDFNSEIIYLISRLLDPSCVGVVEIVVSKISSKKKLTISQFGYDTWRIRLNASPTSCSTSDSWPSPTARCAYRLCSYHDLPPCLPLPVYPPGADGQ